MFARIRYWNRIAQTYLMPGSRRRDFWYERPAAHPKAVFDKLGPYYMTFEDKAAYRGPFDDKGVPLLDFRGSIGAVYHPAAVAQYGLAHYNRFLDGDEGSKAKFLAGADWLTLNLQKNALGVAVWPHLYDYEYRTLMRGPWYSGLAQGQGLSLLARAFMVSGDRKYQECLRSAYKAFDLQTSQGGVLWREPMGNVWIEEFVVQPPSHVLSGFIWAAWGVLDYSLLTLDRDAKKLFEDCLKTLEHNLHRYDTRQWSLQELSDTSVPMVASLSRHRLHIVQLRILHAMTGKRIFKDFADGWEEYAAVRGNRIRSRIQKAAFKLIYY